MEINEAVLVTLGTVVPAACTGLGILISKWLDVVKARREADINQKKAESEEQKSDTATALAMYKDLFVTMKDDMQQALGYIKELENERVAYREENATLKANQKNLEARVETLEHDLRGTEKK